MFPSARDLGGLSRTADSRFIAVVSVADSSASSMASYGVTSCRMTTGCATFVNDHCIGMYLGNVGAIIVVAVVVTAGIIAAIVVIAAAVAAAIVIVTVAASIIAAGIVITSRLVGGGAPAE